METFTRRISFLGFTLHFLTIAVKQTSEIYGIRVGRGGILIIGTSALIYLEFSVEASPTHTLYATAPQYSRTTEQEIKSEERQTFQLVWEGL